MRRGLFREPGASMGAPKAPTFAQRLEALPESVRPLLPPENAEYLARTNDMHCNPDAPGGSKFAPAAEGGVDNILQVVERMGVDELARRVAAREDDREALLAAGTREDAFLPATKREGDPEGPPKRCIIKWMALKAG